MKKSKCIEPPLVLVETWISLLRSKESELVRVTAKEKILSAFGSIDELAIYMKANNLK
jgi:hypothetical protein